MNNVEKYLQKSKNRESDILSNKSLGRLLGTSAIQHFLILPSDIM